MNHPNSLAHIGGVPTALQRAADEAARTGQFISPAPQSPVEAAFSQMDETLNSLHNVVQRLAGRLDSVLSRTGGGVNGATGEAPVNTIAPLVEAMGQRNAQISGHVAALEELERRLAL